jgi:hypothetical protein
MKNYQLPIYILLNIVIYNKCDILSFDDIINHNILLIFLNLYLSIENVNFLFTKKQ